MRRVGDLQGALVGVADKGAAILRREEVDLIGRRIDLRHDAVGGDEEGQLGVSDRLDVN